MDKKLSYNIQHALVDSGELAMCWLGQAGFLLKDAAGNALVIDPYLSNCGEKMRGFKRLSPFLIEPEELETDYYVVTHQHFDHFDYESIPRVAKGPRVPLFLGPSSCQELLAEAGVGPERRRALDRGGVYQDQAVRIQAVCADHGDMAPDAIGVFLEMGGHRLYFSGDTAFREDIIREAAAFKPDIAVLSINGRFGNMNAAEGAEAARLCGAQYAVPCHFWTFAEHGGDPGEFCRLLEGCGNCAPLCFRQGEIQIIKGKQELSHRKETA